MYGDSQHMIWKRIWFLKTRQELSLWQPFLPCFFTKIGVFQARKNGRSKKTVSENFCFMKFKISVKNTKDITLFCQNFQFYAERFESTWKQFLRKGAIFLCPKTLSISIIWSCLLWSFVLLSGKLFSTLVKFSDLSLQMRESLFFRISYWKVKDDE